jgi:hypothetical protein
MRCDSFLLRWPARGTALVKGACFVLRQILTLYDSYYNHSRTHLSLYKDAPSGRAVQRDGNYCRYACSVGATSSLRADMIFGRDKLVAYHKDSRGARPSGLRGLAAPIFGG